MYTARLAHTCTHMSRAVVDGRYIRTMHADPDEQLRPHRGAPRVEVLRDAGTDLVLVDELLLDFRAVNFELAPHLVPRPV